MNLLIYYYQFLRVLLSHPFHQIGIGQSITIVPTKAENYKIANKSCQLQQGMQKSSILMINCKIADTICLLQFKHTKAITPTTQFCTFQLHQFDMVRSVEWNINFNRFSSMKYWKFLFYRIRLKVIDCSGITGKKI